MGTESTSKSRLLNTGKGLVVLPLLYFCSLGPAHVLKHQPCSSRATAEAKARCEWALGAYC